MKIRALSWRYFVNRRNTIFIVLVSVGLTGVLMVAWFLDVNAMDLWFKKSEGITRRCLASNQEAVFEVLEETNHYPTRERREDGTWKIVEQAGQGRVRISVIDITSSTTVWSRELDHPSTGSYVNHQLGRCSFYMPQVFNGSYSTKDLTMPQKAGYSFELWRFNYFSNYGERLVTVAENKDGTREGYTSEYSQIFSVDPSEQYVALLRRDSLARDNLVIKDIARGNDAHVLTFEEVYAMYPTLQGEIDLGRWVERTDGTFFIGGMSAATIFAGRYYIKLGTWDTEVYVTTEDHDLYPAGEQAIAPFAPYMAYTTMYSGDFFTEESEDERFYQQLKEGTEKILTFANLRTGATTSIAKVPVVKGHEYNPTWLSDTELQYTMPDGTRRTYYEKN